MTNPKREFHDGEHTRVCVGVNNLNSHLHARTRKRLSLFRFALDSQLIVNGRSRLNAPAIRGHRDTSGARAVLDVVAVKANLSGLFKAPAVVLVTGDVPPVTRAIGADERTGAGLVSATNKQEKGD